MGPQFFVDGGFVCTYKGITRLLGRGSVRITPAHAGKSGSSDKFPTRCKDHPRTRGEKKWADITEKPTQGSPPHTRGKDKRAHQATCLPRITPAHAGKSQAGKGKEIKNEDHPRTRGEKPSMPAKTCTVQGSPPRVRGKTVRGLAFLGLRGITPARAGKRLNGSRF